MCAAERQLVLQTLQAALSATFQHRGQVGSVMRDGLQVARKGKSRVTSFWVTKVLLYNLAARSLAIHSICRYSCIRTISTMLTLMLQRD